MSGLSIVRVAGCGFVTFDIPKFCLMKYRVQSKCIEYVHAHDVCEFCECLRSATASLQQAMLPDMSAIVFSRFVANLVLQILPINEFWVTVVLVFVSIEFKLKV